MTKFSHNDSFLKKCRTVLFKRRKLRYKLSFFKSDQPGFTLAELLVVIVIIGIVSAIIIFSTSDARAKVRDAQRKADIAKIAQAIARYYLDNQALPPPANTTMGDWPSGFKDALKPYMSRVPVDPLKNNASRAYWWTKDSSLPGGCNGKKILMMTLERTQDPDYGKYNCSIVGPMYNYVF